MHKETVPWWSSTTAPFLRHQAVAARCRYGWRTGVGQGCSGGVKGREGHPGRGVDGRSAGSKQKAW